MSDEPGRLAPSRHRERNTVVALAVYAAVVLMVVVFSRDRGALPPVQPGPLEPAARTGALAIAQQLIDAPRYQPSEDERSAHVNRDWQLIGGVGVNVVAVNPRAGSVNVVLGLARGTVLSEGKFGRETFGDMVRRFRPRVAMNGTYFNPRTNEPVGALVMEGRLIYDGLGSACLYVTEQGDARIDYREGTFGRHMGWTFDVRTAVGSGPSLVRKGVVDLKSGARGFTDPAIFALARRSAVGVTAGGKLLLATVHTPITLNKLANIMLRLGALDAMNLDGGSSAALYSNGQYITIPQRQLTNLILVYD